MPIANKSKMKRGESTMNTKKFGAIIVMLCLTILFSEVLVFASELPDFKLPEMEPLDTPELSKDYNKMLEELEKEGLDNYKYGVDKEDLIAPDVEAPEGTGKKAFEKFKERYGDMWNDPNRQLDRSSTIPDDEFFKAVRDFGKANEQNFGNISKADREAMSNLLKGKLDTSFLRDMKLEKERASKKLLNTKGYLAGTKKPAGWDSVKQQSYVVKKPSLPADQVKRSKSILNKSMMELVWDSIKRSVGDTVSNIKGTYDDLKKIEQILNNKNALSDNDLLKNRGSIKNYSKSLLPFVLPFVR